jgi:phosphonate transport system ATP-binding protein
MHDISLALAYTDRIVGLRDGRITMDEPAAGLTASDLASLYQ